MKKNKKLIKIRVIDSIQLYLAILFEKFPKIGSAVIQHNSYINHLSIICVLSLEAAIH